LVRSDEIRFRQVLFLLSNAVEFTTSGRVTVRAIHNREDGHLRFEIEHTGLGIPTEKRDTMFEKFVCHDDKSLRGNNGAGLGLAIAKERVEMMNGKIGLESGPTLPHQRAVGGATRQRRRTLPNLEKEVAPTALLGRLRR
jgi:signal transduction histidine kinase